MLSILTEADFFTKTVRAWMFQSSFDDAYANAVICDYYGIKVLVRQYLKT
ncbi:hypothetical protein J6TS1_01310 [Siminovitchia terrae]|uniref:Uncharacterized protein n=1 Tax=Siminovitchia terrae TaxID=1914933 RepID=A0ABQ4KQE7_SIMTE|nr:hypothetical protein J6TS1_01310 [Siminovitchia terrae]